MSLSRILNDEPPPATSMLAVPHPSASTSAIDPALISPSSTSQAASRSPVEPLSAHSGDTRRGYAAPAYQGGWAKDPYTGEWVHGDDVPSRGNGDYFPERLHAHSPYEARSANYRESESDGRSRKRRREMDDGGDDDLRSMESRPSRNGIHIHGMSAQPSYSEISPNGYELQPKLEETYLPTEEERRLASSDLEDCEEVWIGELSDYVLETHKRRKQVELWFEASVLERNSTTAVEMSRHYASRISRLPAPPSPPAPPQLPENTRDPSPLQEESWDYEYPPEQRHGDSYRHKHALPDSHLSYRDKGKGKQPVKRPAVDGEASDESSEFDIPVASARDKSGHLIKKRKIDQDAVDMADELERSIIGDVASPSKPGPSVKSKGRIAREGSPESASAAKAPRKRAAPKKKLENLQLDPLEHLGLGSAAPSVSGDVTPNTSRPASPALTATSNIVYELDEIAPPLKRAKKVDDAAMLKRVKALEEAQRKVWTNIARRDVAKVYKFHSLGYQARQSQHKRLAMLASMQARRPFTRTAKTTKDIQVKGKRLMREMLVFWKRNEKEERDVRKREHKEAIDRAKVEEEKREAARQARKLEFLISQTELYSHFVGNKLKTAEMQGDSAEEAAPVAALVGDVDPSSLQDINFDDEDSTNLHRHAKHNAQEAIALAKARAQQFDAQAALDRKTNQALQLSKAQAHVRDDAEERGDGASDANKPIVDLDSDELNFQNPDSLSGPLTIGQPKILMAQLKEYQLKGLNWLATLYEQGINGILADEMGLGKTVQSISLLAYLAETHDIWGPFLVVAPASTLHNWQQELTRFVPGIKAIPYWGNVKDRATLRKFWSKKDINYNKDAPFHVLITSYQLITQDQQYFQRVKWQYMILDEAQNIKNSSSVRWKTLLGFQCRNRLLLTGTPIQNSMQELWALLHFIMPSLFDSHDEFNEWFSKDIESAAENKGSKLNERQLRRLHMILKPFMLRRIKRNVQNELVEKIEKDIYVDLSARQRGLYRGLLANVSIADLLAKAANIGDADSARSLMNLVMQFRKVCNHPELFERADVVSPFSFSQFGRPGPLSREGDFVELPYSTRNPIEYDIPKLLYQDGGILRIPNEVSKSLTGSACLTKLFNIWSTDWIHRSICEEQGAFGFLRILNLTPGETHTLHMKPLMTRKLLATQEEARTNEESPYTCDPIFAAHTSSHYLSVNARPSFTCLAIADGLPSLSDVCSVAWAESYLSRAGLKWFVPPAIAPVISSYCTDRTYLESQSRMLDAPLESLALYGLPVDLRDSEEEWGAYRRKLPGMPAAGLVGCSPADQLPMSNMQIPEAKRLIYDSAKLARLDTLLQELKTGDHRVLIYFQMTRMMDLMEEYLVYRQYKYLRLDGSSKLEDRRDMVIDWQTRPDIFVFLLSTRAGGLGINLTAADTVVFYDHDWNPSNDAQAMDRAHRLGQTRQVTVYRLITKGTIDERIVQLARVKKDVQDLVVGNKSFTDVTKPSEIVQLLLTEDQLAGLDASSSSNKASGQSTTNDAGGGSMRDLWNDEGDDFFGHSAAANIVEVTEEDKDGAASTPVPAPPAKKRKGATGAPRGRRPGSKNKPKNPPPVEGSAAK
ncbi:hypothetical protein HWV62_44327 [Athelia sp. TMB]|nr:hypothetical protein HWV62_44327 [Athelia sp. TMB]